MHQFGLPNNSSVSLLPMSQKSSLKLTGMSSLTLTIVVILSKHVFLNTISIQLSVSHTL